MPFGFGFGELIIFLFGLLIVWALPLCAVVWALVTLSRLRAGQQELRAKVESLERTIRGRS